MTEVTRVLLYLSTRVPESDETGDPTPPNKKDRVILLVSTFGWS